MCYRLYIIITKFLITSLVSTIIIYRNTKENNQRVFGSWKNFFPLAGLTYGWLYFVLLAHEWGHALTALIFGNQLIEINLGYGPTLIKFSQIGNLQFKTNCRLLPLGGFTRYSGNNGVIEYIIICASGVALEFLFARLVYVWLKKRAKRQNKLSLGQVWMLNYCIKIIFWVSFIGNCIPFILPTSDYTRITKILLGVK